MFGSRKPKILVKGTLAERSWAATLTAISTAELTGQLILNGDGHEYRLAFAKGLLVGAVSPAPCDTVHRIALSSHAVPPANVAAAMRIVGRSDDVAKFADSACLGGADATQFKRRVIIQRAARTFVVERGDYVFTDRVTIPVVTGVEVDVRAAIYRGMRTNLSELRLGADLRALGARFILHPEALEHVTRFDFDGEAGVILEALRSGTSAAELEARFRALDPRLIFAVLGALATCRVISAIDDRTPMAQDISIARTPTPREPTISRVPTQRQPTTSSSIPVALRQGPPTSPRLASGSHPRIVRDFDNAPTNVHPSGVSGAQVEQLLASRVALLDAGADLFTFLGLPFDAPVSHVRAAYLEFSRYLRPDRLAQFGIHDRQHEARTVFAQAVVAMTVLTDESRRAEYVSSFTPMHSN
ncbi:MAG: DUF4388 domain-containing protein [Myxococcota bacterium]|nr:DUF4388 domain-containing protein [Myxococcota bacterium]